MTSSTCPVPIDQIPIKEYQALTESIFFSWPLKSKNYLYRKLTYSWLILIPIMLIISSGSNQLLNSPIKLILTSIIWSFILPLTLLIRHLLSWNYIYRRLNSDVIIYEESGWYDGQIWKKNIEMKEKDNITAQYDIQPIIKSLNQTFCSILITFIFGIILISILPFN